MSYAINWVTSLHICEEIHLKILNNFQRKQWLIDHVTQVTYNNDNNSSNNNRDYSNNTINNTTITNNIDEEEEDIFF